MESVLSFGSASTRLPQPASISRASEKPGFMVGLSVALMLALPFWVAVACAIRAIIR